MKGQKVNKTLAFFIMIMIIMILSGIFPAPLLGFSSLIQEAPVNWLNNLVFPYTIGSYFRSPDNDVHPKPPPYQKGWPVHLDNWIFSDIVAGDIDRDGLPEIVVGDLKLHVLNHDGTEVPGWPRTLDQHVMSSPALADIDSDGFLEIVVNTYYSLYVFNHDGSILWQKSINRCSMSSPTIGDLDHDGDFEIVMSGSDTQGDPGLLCVWDHKGNPVPGWPLLGLSAQLSSPALADLDGDRDLEIIIGADDGYVHAWHHNRNQVPGWPQFAGGGIVFSSPAVGDVDGDSKLEIAAGSSSGYMYLWRYNGKVVPGWPQRTPIGNTILHYRVSHPALGDLDRDGDLEVVVAANVTLHNIPGEPLGKVFAWHHDGRLFEGWPVDAGDEWVTTSPLLVDINNDDRLEIITASDRPDCIFAWNINGDIIKGFPLYPEPGAITDMRATPLIADLDRDGDLELIAPSYDCKVYAWDLQCKFISNSHDIDYPIFQKDEWPMFQKDERNTGVYPLYPLSLVY